MGNGNAVPRFSIVGAILESPACRHGRQVTHISQNPILWESGFDSFSLEGEAFGGNLRLVPLNGSKGDTGHGFSPRGEAVSHWLFGTNG